MAVWDDIKKAATGAVKGFVAAPYAGPEAAAIGAYANLQGGGGGGGGGGSPAPQQVPDDKPNAQGHYAYNPIFHYIRQGHPGMTRNQAKDLYTQYQTAQLAPGLSDFVNQRTQTPDPNSMQLFYGQTIAPMLAQANAQYMQGANAGTEAMQKIIAGSTGSPALDVLKSYIPVQQAGAQQMSAALQAGTVAGPYLDQLMTQLQNTQQSQQQQHADEQARTAALLYGSGTKSASGPSAYASNLGLKVPGT